jgi:hypothetical protein
MAIPQYQNRWSLDLALDTMVPSFRQRTESSQLNPCFAQCLDTHADKVSLPLRQTENQVNPPPPGELLNLHGLRLLAL